MARVWPLQMAHTDKLVLLALADNANDEGQCWPSVSSLCEKTCLSDRAVQHAVARLTEAGHVSVNRRYKKSNVFVVHPVYPEPRSPERPSPENPSPERNDISTPNDVHPLKTEPSKRTVKGVTELSLHQSLPRTSWEEWLAYRRENRYPLSPRALSKQLKLLADYDTATQSEIIDTAINAGWQGLFRPKGKSKSKDGQQWM